MATEGVNSSHFDPPTPLHISQPERPGFFRDDNRPHSSCRSAASDDDDTRPVLTHTAKVIIAVVVFALGVLAGAAIAALSRPHELPVNAAAVEPVSAICSTSSTIARRNFRSSMCANAFTRSKPWEVARKSLT